MKTSAAFLMFLGVMVLISWAPRARGQTPEQQPVACVACMTIRVGLPVVMQGPGPGIPDNPFSEIQLPGGRFRGFSASGATYAIDGSTPWDMQGKPVQVLGKAPAGQYGDSGEWINHVEFAGNTLLGWAHDETGDRPGMGLKSMSLVASADDGMHWRRLGQILTTTEPVIQGEITGVGDCTALDGNDGYYYAYCWWNHPGGVIVARAPVADPAPGHWEKYFNGTWSEPGLRGSASKLDGGVGTAATWWRTIRETMILGAVPGGIGLYFSQDHVTFTRFPVPVIPGDNGSWRRPEPHELVIYADLLDADTGSNQLGDHWLLAYTYVQPNEDFGKRYLVFRPVNVTMSRVPGEPASAILLARWYNPSLRDRWSTTAAVPSVNGRAYQLEARSGYLLSAADPERPSMELEDCLSPPGKPLVHALMRETPEGHVCEDHGYTRSRTVGFVYVLPEPGAQPLYSCSDSDGSYFASNSADCDHLGTQEELLGYDMER